MKTRVRKYNDYKVIILTRNMVLLHNDFIFLRFCSRSKFGWRPNRRSVITLYLIILLRARSSLQRLHSVIRLRISCVMRASLLSVPGTVSRFLGTGPCLLVTKKLPRSMTKPSSHSANVKEVKFPLTRMKYMSIGTH